MIKKLIIIMLTARIVSAAQPQAEILDQLNCDRNVRARPASPPASFSENDKAKFVANLYRALSQQSEASIVEILKKITIDDVISIRPLGHDNENIMHLAARSGKQELIHLIQRFCGPHCKKMMEAQNNNGETPADILSLMGAEAPAAPEASAAAAASPASLPSAPVVTAPRMTPRVPQNELERDLMIELFRNIANNRREEVDSTLESCKLCRFDTTKISSQRDDGNSPLHYAVMQNSDHAFRALLRHYSTSALDLLTAENRKGKTVYNLISGLDDKENLFQAILDHYQSELQKTDSRHDRPRSPHLRPAAAAAASFPIVSASRASASSSAAPVVALAGSSTSAARRPVGPPASPASAAATSSIPYAAVDPSSSLSMPSRPALPADARRPVAASTGHAVASLSSAPSSLSSSSSSSSDFKISFTKHWNAFLSSRYSRVGGVALICVVGYFVDKYYKSRKDKPQRKTTTGFPQREPVLHDPLF